MNTKIIKWNLIYLAYLSLFVLALIDNGRGPIYPTLLELLQINTTKGSYLFSIASITGVLVNITARWWLYPLGAIGSQRCSLFFMAIGSLGLSATGFYQSYPLLLISSFTLGVGLSICSISMNVLVAQGSPVEKRKNIFAGLHSVYGISSFLAPYLLLLITKINYNWIHFFFLLTLVCIGILLWSFSFKSKNEVPSESKEVYVPSTLIKRIIFGLIIAFYVASEITISSRLVLYLERAKEFSPDKASQYLSFFFASLLSGRVLLTFVKVRLSSNFVMSSSLILTMLCFFIGYYFHPIALSLTGLTMSVFFPTAMDWLSQSFPKGMEYMTASAMTSVSLLLGVMHWGFGQIAEYKSVSNAMLIAPLCSVLSLLCLWLWNNSQKNIMIKSETI